MADLSNVEIALVDQIGTILTAASSAAPYSFQVPVKVVRGLPSSGMLVGDRAVRTLDVSVFPVPHATRNTTRWGVQTYDIPQTPGVTVATNNNTASFSGSANAGDLAGILAASKSYVYAARAGDSAGLVAAALADTIRADQICWLSGSTVTVPGVAAIVARTVASGVVVQEWSRQEQEFRISIWAADPPTRDWASGAITSGLSTIAFLSLQDGTSGRIRYVSAANVDRDQASSIYRREIVYWVEYATTVTTSSAAMLFGDSGYNGTATVT